MVFNVENLFVLVDPPFESKLKNLITSTNETEWQKLSTSLTPNKPIVQVRALAREIKSLAPDVLMLCEVGGRESLENFSRYFLDDLYSPFLIEGNSDRGIDLGYLVKKSLPFHYELLSHKNRTIDFLYPHERLSQKTGYAQGSLALLKSHRFSRDVLELRLFLEGSAQPLGVFLLVHLKSQLDRDHIDPLGRDRRKAEMEKLIEIYKEIETELGSQTPIFIGGDFNGLAGGEKVESEFAVIQDETQLRDVLDLAKIPFRERFTHMQMSSYGASTANKQLDYLFLSPSAQALLQKDSTFVYRFQDEFGIGMDIPRSLADKRLLPSDHYPIVAEVRWPG